MFFIAGKTYNTWTRRLFVTCCHDCNMTPRTPSRDRFLVDITEAGSVQLALPVMVQALGWFMAYRLWHTAVNWLAAVGVAQAFSTVTEPGRPCTEVIY